MKKTRQKANWLEASTTRENERLPGFFKWAWSSRAVSVGVNAVLLLQLTYYCTDVLGMSAVLVGSMLMVSKIFDGITDLVVGFIIDKTHTRYGKARPYEIAILFAWLFLILLFATPKLSLTGQAAYVFILYTLINSICITFLYANEPVHLARSVRNEQNRVNVMAFSGTLVMIFSIIITIIMPQLIVITGSDRRKWLLFAVVFGIPFAAIGIFRFIFIKEVADNSNDVVKKYEKLSIREIMCSVIKNKYIFIMAGITLMVQIIGSVGTGVNTYYYKYVVGDIGMASVVAMTSIITPIVLIFFPLLSKKIGVTNILRVGAAVGIAGFIIRIAGGTNVITLLIGSLLSGLGVIPGTMMINIYIIDCMDYGEWKTGVRVEGVLTSVNGFCIKVGSGIASGLVGVMMGVAGYNGNLAVQSEEALTAIKVLFNFIPLLASVLLLLLACIYKLDKQMPQIKRDLERARISTD